MSLQEESVEINPPRTPGEPWTTKAARILGSCESAVLSLVGAALVLVAVLLLYSGVHDLWEAAQGGPEKIEKQAIIVLNTVLLVMMTMEIVYTVAISLQSHTLVAEPFLIIGAIAGIRRMLVSTATSTEHEGAAYAEMFRNTLIELGLLSGTVVALSIAIWVLRHGKAHYTPSDAAMAAKKQAVH